MRRLLISGSFVLPCGKDSRRAPSCTRITNQSICMFTENVKLQKFYSSSVSKSKLLYCMASARWAGAMFSLPSRSAMVRATRRMRS